MTPPRFLTHALCRAFGHKAGSTLWMTRYGLDLLGACQRCERTCRVERRGTTLILKELPK